MAHENGATKVAFDGQMGIHPLGLVRSVAGKADAGAGFTFRSTGPGGVYLEGAVVTNRTPLVRATRDIDVLELRQMVAVDATYMMHGPKGPFRPGVDALLVTEMAAFSHVNNKNDFAWGELGAGLYLSGRFDRSSWATAFGVQARLCATVPHE